MSQGSGRKQPKLKEDFLLWLAKEEGRTKPQEDTAGPPPAFMRGTLSAMAAVQKQADFVNKLLDQAQALTDLAEGTVRPPKPVRIGTRWKPETYLGHPPTSSESASLSRLLRTLEDEKLIRCTRRRGKQKRITYVKLTMKGIEAVNELL